MILDIHLSPTGELWIGTQIGLNIDDVVITSFVQGPGSTTLPVYVFGLIRRSVTPEINAVSTLMVTASMILVFSSLAMQRRGES